MYAIIGRTFEFIQTNFVAFGVAGSLIALIAALSSGWGYRGKRGERYSVFNHFISELGENGVSRWARIFNAGLILSGVLLLPFVFGLTLALKNVWAFLGGAAGCVTAIACAMVGVFPMNDLSAHSKAAMTFFRAGLVMMLFYSIAIARQPAEAVSVPRAGLLFSLLGVIAYAAFLVLVRGSSVTTQVDDVLNPERIGERPRFWALPTVEWAIFFATIVWFLGLALLV